MQSPSLEAHAQALTPLGSSGARSNRAQPLASLSYETGTKRRIDILGALLLLTCLFPVMLILYLIVPLTSSGPALLAQRRLTKDGKLFTMFKFRTMSHQAETGTGAVFAQLNDQRITKLGHLLRRTRLDELPQLYNVLVGDMSLIGPRPERPELADELRRQLPLFQRRLEIKAGLTGLAQTRIGYSASRRHYRHKVALDKIYVDNCSLKLDAKIALKTLVVVVTGCGAR